MNVLYLFLLDINSARILKAITISSESEHTSRHCQGDFFYLMKEIYIHTHTYVYIFTQMIHEGNEEIIRKDNSPYAKAKL